MSMIQLNPSIRASVPVALPQKASTSAGTPAAASEQQTSFHILPDAVHVNSAARAPKAMETVKFADQPKPESQEKDGPWKIKRVHVNAGYIAHHSIMHTGPMQIKNDKFNTDVEITGIKQIPRYNWSYINPASGGRFAPDEPQNVVGVNIRPVAMG